MADEKKEPPKAAEGVGGGSLAKPDAGAPSKSPAPAGAGSGVPAAPAKPPAAAPPKPAAAVPPKPAAPKAPVKPDPWSSPLLDELQKRFPGAISEAVIFRNMPSLNVAKEHLVAICQFLKGPDGGAYTLLTDETAADYPKRERRFDVVYHLYTFEGNTRLRLRVQLGAEEKVASVTSIWPTANWLEREIYDMFGVVFEGHPDLKRILLPDEWVGHPLRKDYDILKQDEAWVKANLGIKSGQ
ncbi:MAG: NADH-quinone oxidoreductase subunit C [Acidobacteriota bacterium]|nr:NADH-quinone oxidoreductase subunit C [Acidobacteriota bacterium]